MSWLTIAIEIHPTSWSEAQFPICFPSYCSCYFCEALQTQRESPLLSNVKLNFIKGIFLLFLVEYFAQLTIWCCRFSLIKSIFTIIIIIILKANGYEQAILNIHLSSFAVGSKINGMYGIQLRSIQNEEGKNVLLLGSMAIVTGIQTHRDDHTFFCSRFMALFVLFYSLFR